MIARIAADQHGVVALSQLVALGASIDEVRWRVRTKRLHPVHRGVYLAGHPIAPDRALELAAQLACRPRSLVSHRSACYLRQILNRPATAQLVDVTVVARRPRSPQGIRLHYVGRIARRDVVREGRLWLTSTPRTILDLAACLPQHQLENVIAQARRRELLRDGELEEQLARHPGRRGAGRLRRTLGLEGGPSLTRSPPERRLLLAIRSSELPTPETNQLVAGLEVDLLWREQRLVVEFDSRAYHSDPLAFEQDRLRDARLAAQGYVVIRVTWRQLTEDLAGTLDRIRQALAHRSQLSMPEFEVVSDMHA